jgi:hypothetical protein
VLTSLFPSKIWLKVTVFWDVAPYSLVLVYRRFRGAYCLHHQWSPMVPIRPAKILACPNGSRISNQFLAPGSLIALIMKAVSTSETSGTSTRLQGATYSRRQSSSYSPPWEHEISPKMLFLISLYPDGESRQNDKWPHPAARTTALLMK